MNVESREVAGKKYLICIYATRLVDLAISVAVGDL